MTPPNNEQRPLWSETGRVAAGPVECLGMTFASDEERRAYFTERLRAGLDDLRINLAGVPFTTVDAAVERMQTVSRWPLGEIEHLQSLAEAMRDADPNKDLLQRWKDLVGFPIGADEDILRLSDPPFYTACPNPFLADFIRVYGRPYDPNEPYHREPFAVDVSEGKNDLIYNAHSYHTKVPPRAISRYILHYTSPGDVVLDAFSGSGMTGIGSVLCTDPILSTGNSGIEIGKRKVILCDLSPAATFISSVYLNPPEHRSFDNASNNLIKEASKYVGDQWKFHIDSQEHDIDYIVWIEGLTCPVCNSVITSERVIDATNDIGTAKEFLCPSCSAVVSKAPSKGSQAHRLERVLQSRYDEALGEEIKVLARFPIFAQLRSKNDQKTRIPIENIFFDYLKSPKYSSPFWYPTDRVIPGERYQFKDLCYVYGITHIHHFYLPRQLQTYSCIWNIADNQEETLLRNALKFFIQSNALGMTVLNRYGPNHYSQVNRHFSGTLYIASTVAETSLNYTYKNKRERLVKVFSRLNSIGQTDYSITTQSSTRITQLPNNSIDYIFVDPPFGRNLQYSELNQIWESWLKLKTNRNLEAVMDASRKQEANEYTFLMKSAFSEMFRVLKPGRWITIEFHNSSNIVWLAIQESLMASGFVVADVRTLDKQGDTYKQSRQGLVKQDLVISAYKPTYTFEHRFKLDSGTLEGVWNFIRDHLNHLPIYVLNNNRLETLPERMAYLLYDRMIAFHVQRNVSVPISASSFYAGLEQKFSKRDDGGGNVMYFNPEQVIEYDKKRMSVQQITQLQYIITDEASAIKWLRQQLTRKPYTLQELHPNFTREVNSWERYEPKIDLQDLLRENFLRFDTDSSIPHQIVAWMRLSAELRQIIGEELAEGRAIEDENGLVTQHPQLLAASKGRWYVPDPSRALDLEKLRERALLREFDEYIAFKGRKLKSFRLEAVRAGFRRAWQSRSDEGYRTIIKFADKIPEDVLYEDQTLLTFYDNARTRLGDG